jgi:hypothetical protein
MPIAFKEWAVTVRALAEGEQLVTLRKGGIREERKHFEVEHDRFFLYPTFEHQRNDVVRASHQPELRRALEEGVWPDAEPPAQALTRDGGIPQPDRVRIRCWAEVAAHWTISDPRTVDALSPYYVWTTDYAEKRLQWKRRHPLHVLLLRTYRIPRPVTVKVRDDFHGCRSWLEITRELPFEGTPVLSDDEFGRASEEIEAIVRRRTPAGSYGAALATADESIDEQILLRNFVLLVHTAGGDLGGLLAWIARMLTDHGTFTTAGIVAVLTDKHQVRAFWNSLLLALLVGIAGTALGFLFAFTAARAKLPRALLWAIDAAVLLPLVSMFSGATLIGWAKPVPVTLRYLRHPRRDYMLVAAAGPASR